MRNREFVFTPKIEYELVAERSEANQNSLTFPFWYPGGMSLERPPFGARQIQKQALYLVCALNYTEPKGSHPSKIQIKNLIISDSLFGTLGGKAADAFSLWCLVNIQVNLIFTLRSSYAEPCVRSPTNYQSLQAMKANRLWYPGRESNPRRSP